MGHRLSKIYTKTGDKGTTGLGDNTRVAKDHPRVEAYGTVDELNSAVGVILAVNPIPEAVQTCLTRIQHELFDLGGELCMPEYQSITNKHVERLENELDNFNNDLPMLKEFILPGGGPAAAACHMARAICRRAERRVVTLMHDDNVRNECLMYLNRLSDLLFVIARVLARFEHGQEILWSHER